MFCFVRLAFMIDLIRSFHLDFIPLGCASAQGSSFLMCTHQHGFDLETESIAMRRSARSSQDELDLCVSTPSTILSDSVSCPTSRSSSAFSSSNESGGFIYPHHSSYNSTFSYTNLHAAVGVFDADAWPSVIGVPAVFALTQPHAHPHTHPPTQHSHNSHSPTSYASYTTATGSSVDSFSQTGSSMVEYHPVGEKSGSTSASRSLSLNVGMEGQEGGSGAEIVATTIDPGAGCGHVNSPSVSTVTGSPAVGAAHAQSGTVTGEPSQKSVGGNRLGHAHRPAQYVPLAQAPPREHGQTQPPSNQPRHSHLNPPIHPQVQVSGGSQPQKGRTPTAHATVPQDAPRVYVAPVHSSSVSGKAGTSGTKRTTGKRGRAPKRLRASLTGPAIGAGKSGPAGGGGENSGDDSDDDEGDWEPAGDVGVGQAGTGGSGHGGVGLPGGRK